MVLKLNAFFLHTNTTTAETIEKKKFLTFNRENSLFKSMTRKEFMDKFFDICKDAQEKFHLMWLQKFSEIMQIGWIR